MQHWPVERKIRYERDLDPDFAKGISTTPGGEQLAHCPALTVPSQRVIRKGELIINEKAST